MAEGLQQGANGTTNDVYALDRGETGTARVRLLDEVSGPATLSSCLFGSPESSAYWHMIARTPARQTSPYGRHCNGLQATNYRAGRGGGGYFMAMP